MILKKLFLKRSIKLFKRIFPNVEKEEIKKFLSSVFDRDFKDTTVGLYNSYEFDFAKTKLSSVVEFIEKKKPILVENGTLYRRHEETNDVNGEYFNPMKYIIDIWLESRNKLKKKALKYKNRPEFLEEYEYYNLGQNNKKVIANGNYGATGRSSFHFFDSNSANAIPAKGRALITLTTTTFEDFLCDNIKYFDMEELLDTWEKIISDENNFHDDKVLDQNKTKEEVIERYKNKFYNPENYDKQIASLFLDSVNQVQLNRLYYKNNFYEFLDNKYITDLYIDIFNSTKKFRDPNNIPEKIKSKMNTLVDLLHEYVHYNHVLIDKIYRADKDKRKVTVIIDTDSNILNQRNHLEYLFKKLDIDINDLDAMDERRIKNINILMTVISEIINYKLTKFNEYHCNVDKDAPGLTLMKNELLIDTAILSNAKKKYILSIRMQEGRLYDKLAYEFKNTDFTKPSQGGRKTKDLITAIVKEEFLEYKRPDILKIIKRIDSLTKEIQDNVNAGKLDFMKKASVKTSDAYKNPLSTWQFKAVWIWNSLNPEMHIELPTTIPVICTNIKSLKDLNPIAEFDRDLFDRFRKFYTENKLKGINFIAIPRGIDIPEWLIPLIDTNTILQSNLNHLTPFMQFGMKFVYKTKKNSFISNIIDIG